VVAVLKKIKQPVDPAQALALV